jgi:molecular chaperone GrpE
MRDMLPVLDNLKRAVDAAEKTHDAASLIEGVKLVLKQFYSVLERHHCLPIESLHGPFDPNFHEAVLQQPSEQLPANTVLHEVLPGFRLHDRVVRPSQVVVSTGARPPQAAPPEEEGAKERNQDGNRKK